MPPLCDQRHKMSESLFRQIARDDSHVLHHLLPATHDLLVTESCDCDQQSHFQYFTH